MPSGERFPGQFLTTALIALGLGLAFRLRARLGRRVFALPIGLFILMVLDHGLYNFHITGGTGPVPAWLVQLHQLWGAGREVRGLFLLLLVVAIVLDYWALTAVGDRLPLLPGRPPARGTGDYGGTRRKQDHPRLARRRRARVQVGRGLRRRADRRRRRGCRGPRFMRRR